MTLIVTLFLVIVNIFISVTTQSPKTTSLTSISAWMIACILFICGALLEYGIILLYKHCTSHEKLPRNVKNALNKVDTLGLLVSVVSFLLFNFIFWSSDGVKDPKPEGDDPAF